MAEVFRTIVVTDAVAARALAGDPGMFLTGLSATGTAPATHFVSSGFMPEEIVAPFPDATEEPPFEALARLGLRLVSE